MLNPRFFVLVFMKYLILYTLKIKCSLLTPMKTIHATFTLHQRFFILEKLFYIKIFFTLWTFVFFFQTWFLLLSLFLTTSSSKNENLTIIYSILFQMFMTFYLLVITKEDILENVCNQTLSGYHLTLKKILKY